MLTLSWMKRTAEEDFIYPILLKGLLLYKAGFVLCFKGNERLHLLELTLYQGISTSE